MFKRKPKIMITQWETPDAFYKKTTIIKGLLNKVSTTKIDKKDKKPNQQKNGENK